MMHVDPCAAEGDPAYCILESHHCLFVFTSYSLKRPSESTVTIDFKDPSASR